MDGLLVIDKPAGPTSHDVVVRIRRVLHERRVGHTGTLDPAATGVLPLVIGRATRLARFLSAAGKTYEAVVRLGVATDTRDAQGLVVGSAHNAPLGSREALEEALNAFRGRFLQRPPAYSAKKIDGTRAYALARQQRTREPEPVLVTVHALELVSIDGDLLTLRLECSAGFYVRSLAHDLGERLGTGAHLSALRRTRSGTVGLADALPLAAAEADPAAAIAAILPLERMLPGLAAVGLTDEGTRRAAAGRDLGPGDVAGGWPEAGGPVRLIDRGGRLLGIAEPAAIPGLLHPSVVLV